MMEDPAGVAGFFCRVAFPPVCAATGPRRSTGGSAGRPLPAPRDGARRLAWAPAGVVWWKRAETGPPSNRAGVWSAMNLANYLTLLRIFSIPFLVTVLLTEFPNKEIWGIGLFLAASVTDVLDGYIARRRRQVTTMGILMDPLADKLLISSAFIILVQLHLVPAWMVVIIIGREFAVTGLRNLASSEGLIIRASALGKTKMVFQVVAVCLILAGARFGGIWLLLGKISLWLVLVIAVSSMVHYFFVFWRKIDAHRKKRIRLKRKLFQRRQNRVIREARSESSVE